MVVMSFSSVSLRRPEFSAAAAPNHRSSAIPRRRPVSISFASASPETSTAPPAKPEIELEFVGRKAGDAADKAKAISGEKLLRNIMQDNKIELYICCIWGIEGDELWRWWKL